MKANMKEEINQMRAELTRERDTMMNELFKVVADAQNELLNDLKSKIVADVQVEEALTLKHTDYNLKKHIFPQVKKLEQRENDYSQEDADAEFERLFAAT